jgi:hypothetical protein
VEMMRRNGLRERERERERYLEGKRDGLKRKSWRDKERDIILGGRKTEMVRWAVWNHDKKYARRERGGRRTREGEGKVGRGRRKRERERER